MLYYYSKDGITVASVLDVRRATKNGKFPVKIRVTFQRVRKYYVTGKTFSPEEWEELPRSRRYKKDREDILNSFELVKGKVEALAEKGMFNFVALNHLLSRGQGKTLEQGFQAKIEDLKEEGRIGSMEWYGWALKSLQRCGMAKVPLSGVTADWLKRYEKELTNEGKSQTTIGMYTRAIRTILNDALRTGSIRENQYPFGRGKYVIKESKGRKMALTLQQIGMVVRYDDGCRTTQRYRDFWFFLYLCNGINVADFVQLKYSDIRNGEICYVRQKTKRTLRTPKEICIVFTPEIEGIVRRWGNPPKAENYLFPLLSGHETSEEVHKTVKNVTKNINRRMELIGKALGLGKISTYTARHSYATVLKRSGANIAYISESLGHSDIRTTEAYLASFEREEREKNAALLTRFGEEENQDG